MKVWNDWWRGVAKPELAPGTPNPQIPKREMTEKDQSKKKKKLVSTEKNSRRKKQSEKKDGLKQLTVKEMVKKLEGGGKIRRKENPIEEELCSD